jgi:aminopeptidase-like protein
VRQSLAILKRHLPGLKIVEVPSGTKCFDWEVPREWNIRDAHIISPDGRKICDFKKSNLHIVGYSTPVNRTVSLGELQEHLYSLPDQPDAIPYITSYYKERWGFCIAHEERAKLAEGEYRVFIDSTLEDGSLTYGELVIPGRTPKEVFLSTYVCHPSMANNELSGPAVTTFLAKHLSERKNAHTYRIIFIPETIGSISYLSKNLADMQKNIVAGFNLTCIGDDRAYSYLPSRRGGTLADRAAVHALKHLHPDYVAYSFLERGSDERQYCSPGIDLPVCSIMRTKYGCYPEYHTSLDNLELVTPDGLQGGYELLLKILDVVELNETLRVTVPCEPQLGKRGLYPTLSTKNSTALVRDMMNVLAYADGSCDLIKIADIINKPVWDLRETLEKLKAAGLLLPHAPG